MTTTKMAAINDDATKLGDFDVKTVTMNEETK